MPMLLKNLLQEVEETPNLKIQIYCDMDGVLVDMDKGFRAISGGLGPKEYEAQHGKNTFWDVVNQKDPVTKKKKYPEFWFNLEPLVDYRELWNFIKLKSTTFPPVILSAGQGNDIKEQKEAWIRKHVDSTVRVIIAKKGIEKPNDIIDHGDPEVRHVLIDDTPVNITAWNNEKLHRIAILYKNPEQTKRDFDTKVK